MNETLNSVPTEVKLITDAPAGQVLTSNGDGTSSWQASVITTNAPSGQVLTSNGDGTTGWQAPASGSGTFGREDLPNPFSVRTLNVNRGIITVPGLTGNATDQQLIADFFIDNNLLTADSVVLVSVELVSDAIVTASVKFPYPGTFRVNVFIVQGSIFNGTIRIHFSVL